jgi:hypothetical protein
MDVRSTRRTHQDSHRRVLLVGFPPLMLNGLEPALARVAEVVSVPFPGTAFDRAAEEFDPDMVVVDVTYLDESVIRPLIANRFAAAKPVVAYLSDQRDIWVDNIQDSWHSHRVRRRNRWWSGDGDGAHFPTLTRRLVGAARHIERGETT